MVNYCHDVDQLSGRGAAADGDGSRGHAMNTEQMRPLSAGELPGEADITASVLAANRVFVAIASRALIGQRPEVTLPQWRTLVLLDMHGSVTMGRLAAALGVVPSTATRMCDRLVRKRLVERTTDPANRRQVSVSLLPAGRNLVTTTVERRRQELTRLLATLSPEDQVRLDAAFKTFVRAANEFSETALD